MDGIYNGRVFSVTSGALRGFSSRIISHTLVVDAAPANNRLVVVLLSNGLNWTTLADDDEVIINGADFSGRGAGNLMNFGANLAALDAYDPDAAPPAGGIMDTENVNQQGAEFDTMGTSGITSDITGYLASDQSTNEPYDFPDVQNLFLSGFDSAGNPIPSFHRDQVLQSQLMGLTAPASLSDAESRANLLSNFSLRPFYLADPTIANTLNSPSAPIAGATANFEFFENRPSTGLVSVDEITRMITANGSLAGTFTPNQENNFDVDSDGDGILDSVWIDIGLPTQTDDQGRTFKPLVAYRVEDLDNRVNFNTAGTFADELAAPPTAATGIRGGGYGVAEISPRNLLARVDVNGDGLIDVANDDVNGDGVVDVDDAYVSMLNTRYLSTEFANEQTPPTPMPGVEAGASGDHLGRNQKLFGHPTGIFTTDGNGDPLAEPLTNGLFGSAFDLFGQLQLSSASLTTLPEFGIPATTLPTGVSPYQVNMGLSGSPVDNLFTPEELEGLLRSNDVDSALLADRLRNFVTAVSSGSVTSHSFEVTLPSTTGSLVAKLNRLLGTIGLTLTERNTEIQRYFSPHVLRGGKIDINRAVGNGRDDDSDGVVDNEFGTMERTDQRNRLGNNDSSDAGNMTGPIADLDLAGNGAGGDALARQILAQDLYVAALLVCGENAPAGLTLTSGNSPDLAYREMIAQWAINMVDFRDPDSIMTRFDYDSTPFDGTGWTPDAFVWGAERPELLISETFAYHDRRNEDLDANTDTVADGDNDWDSAQVPQSGAFFELYHPWGEVNGITRRLPEELRIDVAEENGVKPEGVDLGQETPNGDPVWRLVFKRARADTSFARAIYFYDVDTTRSSLMDGVAGDFFFTTLGSKIVAPGEYAVIGSSGNVGERPANSGRYETTFGRRNGSGPVVMDGELDQTRAIILDIGDDDNNQVVRRELMGTMFMETSVGGVKGIVINSPRSLSISDPNGGYTDAFAAVEMMTGTAPAIAGSGDGQQVLPVINLPLDSGANAGDIDAIWNNGVTDNFRFAYLQRLANPLLDHGTMANPYLTIDTAGVDLLAFNGMTTNPSNTMMGANGEVGDRGARPLTQSSTNVKSVERGESKIVDGAEVPRQNLFASEEGNQIDPAVGGNTPVADMHNFSFEFTESFGGLNSSYSSGTGPLGWLTWNNRPFSSAAEIANVPFHSSEWLCYYFNRGTIDGEGTAANGKPTGVLVGEDFDRYELMAFFGNTDQNHKHLLRFGQNNEFTATFGGLMGHPGGNMITATTGTTNRMVNLFDYIEVPSKFLGSETYLAVDATGNAVNGVTTPGMPFPALALPPVGGPLVLPGFNFEVPFHGVPNFRAPGKININTVSDSVVWDAIFGFTPLSPFDFATIESTRDGGAFTTNDGARFIPAQPVNSPDGNTPANGSADQAARGTLFTSGFDQNVSSATKDAVGSPYFRNEFRQRLSNMVTTRSSVFAIWITVGYFEVDEFNRIGAELGSRQARINRNRAFYIFDRSIPMAFEPGRDHNVDNGVLVRTIIQ